MNALPRARAASYDSNRIGSFTTCFEGTRLNILDEIKIWLFDRRQPNVYWLNGLAGIGKTTIAATVAEFADNEKVLGGSFFLSRGDDALSNSGLVFPTLAFQLAQTNLALKSAIGAALEPDSSLGDKKATIQFENLIIKPLREQDNESRILLFVIDALDECSSREGGKEILQLILARSGSLKSRICFLISSRPDDHIRVVFKRAQPQNYSAVVLHNLEESVLLDDIRKFLRAKVTEIPFDLDVEVEDGWPSESDLESLVAKSGKLFIFAATALKFIAMNPPKLPEDHLKILLGLQKSAYSELSPYGDLDMLYLAVLRRSVPKTLVQSMGEDFRWLLGCIVSLRNPLDLSSLSKFAQLSEKVIRRLLNDMHSVIIFPNLDSTDGPQLYHPSFRDFIIDKNRCSDTDFFLDRGQLESRMAARCLKIMNSDLRRDMAKIKDHSLLNKEVKDLSDLVKQSIPTDVQYACLHWSAHLVEVKRADEDLLKMLSHFASTKMLQWFEAMSLLGQTPDAVSMMRDAHDWAVSVYPGPVVISRFIHRSAIAPLNLPAYFTMGSDSFFRTSQ